MKETVSRDVLTMERLSWGAICSILAAVACMVGWYAIWPSPSFIPHISCGMLVGTGLFVALYALALFLAFQIERIKKKHDLVSYSEISAFINGEENFVRVDSFGRKHKWLSNMVKLICGAGVGLIIGFALTVIVNNLV